MSKDKSADRPAGVRVVVDRNGRAFRRIGMGNRKPPAVTLESVTKSLTPAPARAVRRAQLDAEAAAIRRTIKQASRKVRVDDDGPTPLTRLKAQPSSVERMITAREIDGPMLQSLQEIEAVVAAIAGSQMVRGFKVERGSKGQAAPMPERIAWAHAKRFKPWADEMARRRDVYRDPSLDIILSVIDGTSCGECDRKHRVRSGTSKYLVRRGLLEYAQLAGWAPPGALDKFDTEHPGFRVVPRRNRTTSRVA